MATCTNPAAADPLHPSPTRAARSSRIRSSRARSPSARTSSRSARSSEWAPTTRNFGVANTFRTDGFQGVQPGQTYSLVLSLQRQPTNPDFVSLENKTITVIDGGGKGQTGTIKHYDPETHEYTIESVTPWTNICPSTGVQTCTPSKFEISQSMADFDDPVYDPTDGDDSYDVVLTGRPTCPVSVDPCEVVVDVTPLATRTYDSRQAFNPSANFGQGNQVQVRVATTRAHFLLTGTPATGQTWIALLDGQPFPVAVTTGESLATIAQALVDAIDADSRFSARRDGDGFIVEAVRRATPSTRTSGSGARPTGPPRSQSRTGPRPCA